jgi:rhodanese-related sulfurtransferase
MEAREKVMKGEAILVCAYDSDEKFNKMRLQGAIPLSSFKDKLEDIGKEQMIIFYCA